MTLGLHNLSQQPWLLKKIRGIDNYFHSCTTRNVFKCYLEHANKSFYGEANAVFAKIGHVASEEVIL